MTDSDITIALIRETQKLSAQARKEFVRVGLEYGITEWDGTKDVVEVLAVKEHNGMPMVAIRYTDDGLTQIVDLDYFLDDLKAAMLQ